MSTTMLRFGSLSAWSVAALAAAVLCGCSEPARPSPATPGGVEPTAEPAPATPAPPPEATGRCELPPSDTSAIQCWKQEPELLEQLEAAMTAATEAHPEYFNFDDMRCGTCYYVRDVDGYYAELARQLQLRGVCSQQELDEITIKSSNGWSEQFDILLGSGHIRRGVNAYLYTCSPSLF